MLRVLSDRRGDGGLGEDLHRGGERAGVQLVGELLRGGSVEAAGDLSVRADLALDDGSGDELVVKNDRELASASGRVLRTARLVVAREGRELLRAVRVQAEADGELAGGRIALDGRLLEVLARDLGIGAARDEVRQVRAVAVVLEHEHVARIRHLERGEARGIAGGLGDFGEVRGAGIAVALLDVALRRDVLGEELRDELVVLRVREAELEVGGALERRLSGLADLFVHARELDEKAVVLHALDNRLVGAHRVDAAADDFDDAGVAVLESLVDLGLDGTGIVGDVGVLGDDRLGELVGVDAKREGRAALEVKAEAKLVLHGRRDVERHHRDKQQDEPFPDVVAHC